LIETFRAVDDLVEPDWIVPVPLHPKRRLERGFDQTLLLAELLARELCRPVFRGIRRVRDTKPQFGLDVNERRRNLKNAFALEGEDWKAASSLLIVDDVMTTGTTADELSRCFRTEKEDVRIMVLTIARVPIVGYWG
jgi:ComF family protein